MFRYLVLLSLMVFTQSAPLQAARLDAGGEASLNCIATLSGPIEAGDAERFRLFITELVESERSFPGGFTTQDVRNNEIRARICLDSPGGSLAEALNIVDMFIYLPGPFWMKSLGTAIPAGARCESACAILFMAGGNNCECDAGRILDRVLHVRGRLGFHAPGVVLSEGSYSAGAVQSAFDVAIRTTAKLADRLGPLRFRNSLFRKMQGTPPSQMFYVTTVGEAAEWSITLQGATGPAQPSTGNIYIGCLNTKESAAAETVRYYIGSTDIPGDLAGKIPQFDPSGGRPQLTYLSEPISEDYLRTFETFNADAGYLEFKSDTGEDLDHIGCEGNYHLLEKSGAAVLTSSNNWALPLDNWMLLPAATPLVTLGQWATQFGPDGIPAGFVLTQKTRNFTANCRVYKDARQTDNDPCLATSVFTRTADMFGREVVTFTWPSGARTVMEFAGSRILINGRAAGRLDYDEIVRIDPDYKQSCHLNPASGNAFCYTLEKEHL